jgi:hypothetical protein
MGDRASVIFFDKVQVSPVIYLHWHGSRVPDWIEELRCLMAERLWDAPYAAARFVGVCHNHIPGNLSLAIRSSNLSLSDLKSPYIDSIADLRFSEDSLCRNEYQNSEDRLLHKQH